MSTPSLATKPALTVATSTSPTACAASSARSLRGVSLQIERGGSYGLVGESGCGKSTVAMAVMRYLPSNGSVTGGSIYVDGEDLLAMGDADVRALRTRAVSMVYQNPGAALNPAITHRQPGGGGRSSCSARAARRRASARARCSRKVQISDPDGVMQPLPPPALRRHAAARDHRDGAGVGPEPADPRRADHGPRRHRRGRGARPGRGPARRVRHGRALHQPQPRRDRAHVRPRRRALRRPAGRGRAGRCRSSRTRATPTRVGLLRCLPQRRACASAKRASTRSRASCRRSGSRLPRLRLRRPLPARCRSVCRTDEPPLIEVGPLRGSRCHFHALAPDMPRVDAREAGRRPAAGPLGAADGAHGRPEQDVPPGRRRGARARRHHARGLPRRDARARGRVGQRQEHARARAARA